MVDALVFIQSFIQISLGGGVRPHHIPVMSFGVLEAMSLQHRAHYSRICFEHLVEQVMGMRVHERRLREGVGRDRVLEHLVLTDSSECEVVRVTLAGDRSVPVARYGSRDEIALRATYEHLATVLDLFHFKKTVSNELHALQLLLPFLVLGLSYSAFLPHRRVSWLP